ncbi:cysteine hydrolase family protein [Staphylococcus massiliensis]|uniref:Isochorismatase family protein n=1 Tax=Staphylococcus massiliensis S46 TaxID=1229783 RepID=K9ALI5_9STAP|nr:isochorismatase family cysteine hydrolase [Staphylococcus massiliensis]EKU46866.1 isochorismatase family protein [Staphylococcus massiliensis S46]MCG3399919.1 cysteine hydrolase [Staphylococcus massiliensis]MCG3402638.1 cysteine hydrolase [Staphylococcus massiliensis]MCG3412885.1 cysteine hydrolase [Staphylococcus massiliensis]PNZ98102.1 cysteine hydrolase [Staphylococcus massiliensis CCUG 55927]
MSQKALIVVDYSNDFIADDGKLTCGVAGQAIEPFILERLNVFNDAKDHIFFMMDLHNENDPYHPETKLFPPHNLKDTTGRELFGRVKDFYDAHEDDQNVHYIDKTRYDSFYGTNLDSLLRERGITEIEIVGVCTDICVLHTAVSAYNLNYKMRIPKNGVASFDLTGHEWALQHFKNSMGAQVD